MSETRCPYCGATFGSGLAVWKLTGEGWRVGCVNEKCSMAKILTHSYPTKAEAIAAWNRRYVCNDKNGKPVYAGDEVKCRIRPTERCGGDPEYDTGVLWWDNQDLLFRLAITGNDVTKKRFCAFYDEIELIKEAPNEE